MITGMGRLHTLGIFLYAASTVSVSAEVSVLHHFSGGSNDGDRPWTASVLVRGTNLFGMTMQGGSAGKGVVFRLNSDGTGYTNLHSFGSIASDGTYPRNSLTISGNTLYGTTESGGLMNRGTVFSLNDDGSAYEILHDFQVIDGWSPHGDVLRLGDSLFGLTRWGGSNGMGVVFRRDLVVSNYTVLHHFSGGSSDGNSPHFGITWDGSFLYGQTYAGGTNGAGVVWRMNSNGSSYQNLHSFSGADGAHPQGYVRLTGGQLYGTAPSGGNYGYGVAFRLNADGGEFTVLHHFGNAADARSPLECVIMNGYIFGSTGEGGAYGLGAIYRMNLDGAQYELLHSFSGSDGFDAAGALAVSEDGRLYGMTGQGGAHEKGVIYSFVPFRPEFIHATVQPGSNQTHLSMLVTNTIPGHAYEIQFSQSLGNFLTISNQVATDRSMTVVAPIALEAGFFRIKMP
jgi:uncharacterized repeat protein (TIGR03803 family)